jgi:DNA-binding NarL/FixJ family response regulator
VLSNAAEALLLLGRWAEADALLADGQARHSNPYDEFTLLIQRAQLALLRGDRATTSRCLAEAELRSPSTSYPPAHAGLQRVKAQAALCDGDIAAARDAVDAALEILAGGEDAEPVLDVLTVAARVEADAGAVPGLASPERVARLKELLDRAEASVSDAIVEAEVESLLCRAEVARVTEDDAPALWAEVTEAARRHRHPYRVAYALSRQGEAALRERDRQAATALLREALAIATRLGAQPLVEAAQATAARARLALDHTPGGTAPVPPRAASLHLTRREVEVLGLLVEGRSNREIARRLAMTEKTASVHVSRILGKLGVRRRGEAAAVAGRLHLLDDDPPPRT